MNSLKPEEDQNCSLNSNAPMTTEGVVIQLKGTHTSSTETESPNLKEKKNVQFGNKIVDDLENQRKSLKKAEATTEEVWDHEIYLWDGKEENQSKSLEKAKATTEEIWDHEIYLWDVSEENQRKSLEKAEATTDEVWDHEIYLRDGSVAEKDDKSLSVVAVSADVQQHEVNLGNVDEVEKEAKGFSLVIAYEEQNKGDENQGKSLETINEKVQVHEIFSEEVCVVEEDEQSLPAFRDSKQQCKGEEVSLPSNLEQSSTVSNLDISQRFNQIMNMFDNFTKNLETLDLAVKPLTTKDLNKISVKRKRPESLHSNGGGYEFDETLKHRSRYDEFYEQGQVKDFHETQAGLKHKKPRLISCSNSSEDLINRQHFEEFLEQQKMELKDLEEITKEARSVSVATSSCQLKTLACQTQSNDNNSLDDLALMEVSSLTSRSEPVNSLNNYAQAGKNCSEPKILKKPVKETFNQPPPISPSIINQEPRVSPPFNVITIEANPSPSSTDLRRAPLCERMWTVIGDFCAATFLCLQVNRDCIFCLGFFAAFVVSASFLTAFFYHTLSVSPILWQGAESVRM